MGDKRNAPIDEEQRHCDESARGRAAPLKATEVAAIIGCLRPKPGDQRVHLCPQSRRPATVKFALIANPVSIRDHSRR